MKKTLCLLIISCLLLNLSGCAAVVYVTKTAKGYHAPTDPDNVDILMIAPTQKEFIELATVTSLGWNTAATAKMHNSLRAKSAPMGADAVIILNSGIDYNGYFWTSGVAIRYKEK